MKKSLILIASLTFGSTAIAQDAPPAPPMTNSPATNAPEATSQPAPPMPAQDAGQPAPPPAGDAPPASPPSDGAAPPSGGMANGNMPSGQMANGNMSTPADTSSYPACSRGVTDKCVQRHEMSRKSARPRHR